MASERPANLKERIPLGRAGVSSPLDRKSRAPGTYLSILALLATGVALSILAFRAVERGERDRRHAEFERTAAGLTVQLRASITAHLKALSFIEGLFEASTEVNRQEFAAFAGRARPSLPGLRHLCYAPRLSSAGTALLPGRGLGPSGSARPLDFAEAGPGDRFPIEYIAPANDADELFGVDLSADRRVREALARSLTTGEPTATCPEAGDSSSGVFVILPIHRNRRPAGEETARGVELLGIAVADLAMDDLLRACLVQQASADLCVKICDVQTPDRPVELTHLRCIRGEVQRIRPLPSSIPETGRRETPLEVAGRKWVFVCAPADEAPVGPPSWAALAALFVGIVLTCLAAAYLALLQRRGTRIQALVDQRTEELSRANAELEAEVQERGRAERSARASQTFLQTVIDAITDATTVIDNEYRIVLANQAVRDLIGTDPVAQGLRCYQATHGRETPCDGLEHPCPLRLLREGNGSVAVSHTHRDKDGRPVYVELTAAPIFDAEGRIIQMVEWARDVSESKRYEMRLARLKDLNEDLIRSGSLEEKLARITDGVVRIFEADFARVWIIRPGDRCESGCVHAGLTEGPHVCRHRDRCLHLLASSGRYTHLDGEVHRRVPFGCYKIGRVAAGEDRGFITNDVTRDPRVHNHEWARETGLTAFAGYRLAAGGNRPLGVLALFSANEISPEEDALLETLANTTAQVVQATLAEETMLREKNFSESAMGSLPGIFYLFNEQGRMIRWNHNFEKVTGYSREEIESMPPTAFFGPVDAARVAEEIRRVFTEGYGAVEADLVHKNGAAAPHFFTGQRIELDGQVLLVGMGIDITARKQAERELEGRIAEVSEAKRRLEILVANTTGREKRMVELKREVNELMCALGREARYQAPDRIEAVRRARLGASG